MKGRNIIGQARLACMGNIGLKEGNVEISGFIGLMEKKMETTILYRGYILGLYWCYIGIVEKKMETTIVY